MAFKFDILLVISVQFLVLIEVRSFHALTYTEVLKNCFMKLTYLGTYLHLVQVCYKIHVLKIA